MTNFRINSWKNAKQKVKNFSEKYLWDSSRNFLGLASSGNLFGNSTANLFIPGRFLKNCPDFTFTNQPDNSFRNSSRNFVRHSFGNFLKIHRKISSRVSFTTADISGYLQCYIPRKISKIFKHEKAEGIF